MKNKLEIFYILLLIIICIVSRSFFGENIYSPYSDIGRELYIAEQVKNGAVLYKDIFNVYAPLGYWFNALIIKFFGNNLSVFQNIGLTLSILTIIPIFFISKIYTNRHLAFFSSLFIIYSCVFYPSISNWITPYSYSIVYALCTSIWSFLFLLKHIQEDNKKYLYISSFLAGLSICFKYEFAGIFIVILTISIFKKEYLKTILSYIITPIICLTILFIQGCNINNIQEAITYIIGISKSKSTLYFYEYAKLIPTIENIKYSFSQIVSPNFKNIFAPICIINTVLLLISLKKKTHLHTVLLLSALLIAIKSLGCIQFEIYGTYFFPLLFIGLISVLYKEENKIRNIYLCTICLLLSICYLWFCSISTNKLLKIETHKGNIKISSIYYNSTVNILNYINNLKTDKKILILPEGTLINYLSDKRTDNWLYYLIPPNNDIFKKEFIEQKILSKDIEYIITTNIQYPWYNEKSFMTGWGKGYLDTIKQEYNLETIIGENLKFYIYKHDIIK